MLMDVKRRHVDEYIDLAGHHGVVLIDHAEAIGHGIEGGYCKVLARKYKFETGIESEWFHFDRYPRVKAIALRLGNKRGFRGPTRCASIDALNRSISKEALIGDWRAFRQKLLQDAAEPLMEGADHYAALSYNLIRRERDEAILSAQTVLSLLEKDDLTIEKIKESISDKRGHEKMNIAAMRNLTISRIEDALHQRLASELDTKDYFEIDWNANRDALVIINCDPDADVPVYHWKARQKVAGELVLDDADLYKGLLRKRED
jgi:hypothetical protein